MERHIGFLEGVSGHTYDTIFDLLFTTERVIALIVAHPTDVTYKFGITEALLGGLLTRQRERFIKNRSDEGGLQDYQGKTFDELLTGHRFNFEIPYPMVTTVELSCGWFQRRLNFHLDHPSLKRRIIHFTLAKDQVSKAQELLKLALPLKIKEK
jgi:hypothetical protein